MHLKFNRLFAQRSSGNERRRTSPVELTRSQGKLCLQGSHRRLRGGLRICDAKKGRRAQNGPGFTCQCLEINGAVCTLISCAILRTKTILQQAMAQAEKMMSLGEAASGMARNKQSPRHYHQSLQGIQRRFSPDLPANVSEAPGYQYGPAARNTCNHETSTNIWMEFPRRFNRAANIVNNMLNFGHRSDSAHL